MNWIEELEELEKTVGVSAQKPVTEKEEKELGGPGSGFFGHAGRKGKVGGSSSLRFEKGVPKGARDLLLKAYNDVDPRHRRLLAHSGYRIVGVSHLEKTAFMEVDRLGKRVLVDCSSLPSLEHTLYTTLSLVHETGHLLQSVKSDYGWDKWLVGETKAINHEVRWLKWALKKRRIDSSQYHDMLQDSIYIWNTYIGAYSSQIVKYPSVEHNLDTLRRQIRPDKALLQSGVGLRMLESIELGGVGSGFFGHSGRPGELGGSVPGKRGFKSVRIRGGSDLNRAHLHRALSYVGDFYVNLMRKKGVSFKIEPVSLKHIFANSYVLRPKGSTRTSKVIHILDRVLIGSPQNIAASIVHEFAHVLSVFPPTRFTPESRAAIEGRAHKHERTWAKYVLRRGLISTEDAQHIIAVSNRMDEIYKERLQRIQSERKLESIELGGPGSGFFGHVGRPGKEGGSTRRQFSSIPRESLAWSKMSKGLAKQTSKAVERAFNTLDPRHQKIFLRNVKQIYFFNSEDLPSSKESIAAIGDNVLHINSKLFLRLGRGSGERVGVIAHELAHTLSHKLSYNIADEAVVNYLEEERAGRHSLVWAKWANKKGLITKKQMTSIATFALQVDAIYRDRFQQLTDVKLPAPLVERMTRVKKLEQDLELGGF